MSGPIGQRGRRGLGYTLITPDNQYVSRLPDLPDARFVKLVTPRLSPSRLAQYLIDAAPNGSVMRLDRRREHFLYGLAGDGSVGGFDLADEGFAYLPPGADAELSLEQGARVLWFTRSYEALPRADEALSGSEPPGTGTGDASRLPPEAIGGHARALPPTATVVDGLWRRELIDPSDPAFDFNMSLLSFDPGVALHQIEIHDEEHGLYMTAGGGDYLLGADTHQVQAGDFIYMAPYTPQWFGAGAAGGEYLLYKDVYRTGF